MMEDLASDRFDEDAFAAWLRELAAKADAI
jgi:hypothetical protein